jgi:hypothetical protein
MAWDETGGRRPETRVEFSSSDEAVAQVTPFGHLMLRSPGAATITARAEGISKAIELNVAANPIVSFELTAAAEKARTGDVIRFNAIARICPSNTP